MNEQQAKQPEAINDLSLFHQIEQFYFREARLLDDRKFQEWYSLLSEDVRYTIPTRHTPMLDPQLRETEAVLNIKQELNHGLEPPLRDDNYLTLMIRTTRAFKLNAWADNPPPRTRRIVSNLEVYETSENRYQTFTNVMMSYSRHDRNNHIYTFQRQDELIKDNEGFRLSARDIILDWNVVTGPSVGLIF
jgi:3-phenylpropionate/cinnamic acid dioxygenase small subunit